MDFLKKYLGIKTTEDKLRLEKESIDSEIDSVTKSLNCLSLDLNKVKNKLTKDLNLTQNPNFEKIINQKFNNYFEDYLKKAKDYNLLLTGLKLRRKEFTKKISTASIILNNRGEILLLKRVSTDSFHPNTWCLPGGGIDIGSESIIKGAYRELLEETNLDNIDLVFEKNISLEKIDLFYFIGYISNFEKEITLDYTEHSTYIWAPKKMWLEMDLILDLKSHLEEILTPPIKKQENKHIIVEDSSLIIETDENTLLVDENLTLNEIIEQLLRKGFSTQEVINLLPSFKKHNIKDEN